MPELFLTKYFCQSEEHKNFNYAEGIPGPSTDFFSIISKKFKIILIVPLFEKKTKGLYHNSSVVLDEKGKFLENTEKCIYLTILNFMKNFILRQVIQDLNPLKLQTGNLGTLICWDQWFPEAARLTALKGAEIIFYPTAIGWHPKEKKKFGKSQLEAWLSVQRSHAIANGIYVAAINRVGIEKQGNKKIEFWGNSVVFDPSGNIVKKSGLKENVLVCEIDFKNVESSRRHWPFFRDRRIDFYKGLMKNPKDA